MSKHTFPFTSASLRALRVEQELQEWEDSRRALARRRAMTRPPLPRAPRPPPPPPTRERPLQEVRAPPPPVVCRDTAVHDTFTCGDMRAVYAVLKDPAWVNALMETVHDEMIWAPEMGMWTLRSTIRQTSALRLAASRGRSACAEELLFRGAEVDADPGGRTALHDACATGHAACTQLLLAHGADPNRLADDGSAPLHLCTAAPSLQCAEVLLAGGAEVNVSTRESQLTPLHVAACQGQEELVALLLAHGADVLARNREGETPLNGACAGAERPAEAGRYLRVALALLDAGAEPRTAGRKGHTPLHNACANCSPRIAEALLLQGAHAHLENSAGYTPMDCLLQVVEDYPDQQPEAVARSLLNHGAKAASTKMLTHCTPSPATLEVMLNSYTVIPGCEWMESLSADLYEKHEHFFDLVRQMSGQPRSLQHLCRCALRQHFGARCYSAISKLDLPSSVRDYLLLYNSGMLH